MTDNDIESIGECEMSEKLGLDLERYFLRTHSFLLHIYKFKYFLEAKQKICQTYVETIK